MENNKSANISSNELDSLLSKAFLNLDFENKFNREVLEIVTKRAMYKSPLATFFNGIRFNFFFFLLSLILLLTSTYRHIYPLLNGKDKQINSMSLVRYTDKKKSVLPQINHTKKIISEPIIKNISKTNVADALKRGYKIESAPKKNRKQLSIVTSKINITDSNYKSNSTQDETKDVTSLKSTVVVDSLAAISLNKAQTFKTKALEQKSVKKIKPLKAEIKTKTGRRRGGKMFHKDGTFKMQGRKYGKSSRL